MQNQLLEKTGIALKYWSDRYKECEKRFYALQESYHRADDPDVLNELNKKLLDAEIDYHTASEELKKARLDYLISDEKKTPTVNVLTEWKRGRLPN